ncbi:MAG TPA: response regulator [Rhizobiales bacterium]|nr:response regulator [Hyphomicrobiales bacterium]
MAETGQFASAVICLPGFASAHSLASYLQTAGIETRIIEDCRNPDEQGLAAGAIFAPPQVLDKLPTRPDGTPRPWRIAMTEIGETRAEEMVLHGSADDLMMQPVSRAGAIAMIARLAKGSPRGPAAVTSREESRRDLPQFTGTQVLVADDNAVNREVIIEVLRQLGVNADVAHDGRQAADMWKNGSYQLIFMDCSMPVLDGYQATIEIRNTEKATGRTPVPVIALTAQVAGDDTERWRKAGMNDFITKPFTVKTIANAMSALLGAPAPVSQPMTAAPANTQAPAGKERQTEQAAPDLEPVIDMDVINDLKDSGGGSNALLERVLVLFEENAAISLKEIEDASGSDEADNLADAAHALKSMCANIGAARTAAACARLELAMRRGDEIDIPGSLREISQTLAATLDEIQTLRQASL